MKVINKRTLDQMELLRSIGMPAAGVLRGMCDKRNPRRVCPESSEASTSTVLDNPAMKRNDIEERQLTAHHRVSGMTACAHAPRHWLRLPGSHESWSRGCLLGTKFTVVAACEAAEVRFIAATAVAVESSAGPGSLTLVAPAQVRTQGTTIASARQVRKPGP